MTLGQFFTFPPTLSPRLKTNFIYLFWDIGVWGLYMGATASFLTIYASRCGATSEQIGLLTALPALVALLLSLPFGRWLKRFPAQRATVWSAFTSRVLFIGYAFLPWLLPINHQFEGILAISLIITIPTAVINISYTQFFMESVPSEWRGAVVGTRNAIGSIISFIVTILCGQILTRLPFPANYQVVFVIGFIGGILTVYQIYHVRPVTDPSPLIALSPARPAEATRWLPRPDGQGRKYIRVIGLLFLFTLTNNMFAPLIPNLLVNHLKLSDGVISAGTATSTLVVLVVSLFIARFTRRAGNRPATAYGAGLLAFQAVALAVAQNAFLYLVSAVIGGIATGILNAAQYNYHLDNVPDTERPSWLSVNQVLGNAAILLGALLGPLLARGIGTPNALIAFGGLRLLVGFILFKWG